MVTEPRISDERLAAMIANAGLFEEIADHREVEGLARDLRDARARIAELEREPATQLRAMQVAWFHAAKIGRFPGLPIP